MRPMKSNNEKIFLLFLGGVFIAASAGASTDPAKAPLSSHRSTNITVTSSELEPFDLNRKTDAEERIKFYQDENTVVGFNDQGEPGVGTRF